MRRETRDSPPESRQGALSDQQLRDRPHEGWNNVRDEISNAGETGDLKGDQDSDQDDSHNPADDQPAAVLAASDIVVEHLAGAALHPGALPATVVLALANLVGRAAEPNPFLHPAFLAAAATAPIPGPIVLLLAWHGAGRTPDALLGAWAFRQLRSPMRLWSASIEARVHDFAFLATPLVDATAVAPVIPAMLDAIRASGLPNRISLSLAGDEGPVMDGLRAVLDERQTPMMVMATYRRALARRDDPAACTPSASSRKKLRQYRRRLAEQGEVATTRHTTPAEVTAALEEFLALEAAGWKGRAGTAVLNDAADTGFVRAAFPRMAETGDARIEVLRLDGKPAAIQILARAGRGFFTWKIAYDEALRDYSPGVLLVEDYTAALLADPSVAFLDSCSHDDTGFMASLWKDRQAIADVVFDARPGEHAGTVLINALERRLLAGRAVLKRLFHRYKDGRKAAKG